jgi:hypothetical protein
MKKYLKFGFILALFMPLASHAWDGAYSATISQIEVVPSSTNSSFRIYLTGTPKLCSATNSDPFWTSYAFLNSTSANYNAIVATLLSAKASGQKVSVYTTNTPFNGTNQCLIGDIIVQ